MSRRVVAVVVMVAVVASILAVAGMLWAKAAPKGGDYNRCLTTCNTLIKDYGMKRATLKSHEGDKQCWSTCDTRLNRGANAGNVQAMKTFWTKEKSTNLHPNQCAQACWRRFHKGSETVNVAGWRSEPRSVACTPAAGRQTASR